MKTFIVTGATFSSIWVSDTEFTGGDVVIGKYEASSETEAKQKAEKEHNIPFEELNADQIA